MGMSLEEKKTPVRGQSSVRDLLSKFEKRNTDVKETSVSVVSPEERLKLKTASVQQIRSPDAVHGNIATPGDTEEYIICDIREDSITDKFEENRRKFLTAAEAQDEIGSTQKENRPAVVQHDEVVKSDSVDSVDSVGSSSSSSSRN